MHFLNQIFFDNTIQSYLIVGGVILLTLLLKRYLSRYLVSLLFLLVKKIWKTVSKASFVTLVVGPFEWLMVILITVFSIDKLQFPHQILFTIYGHTSAEIVGRAGTGIIIVFFIALLLRLIDFIAMVLEINANLTAEAKDNQLVIFFRDFLKVLIVIMGILLLIKACFNQPLGNLLTGLSIVGAALALGAKESLENLIASFIIFFDKPFFTGDTVNVINITGSVEKIGLRSTRILTADKTIVTVPNKLMVDSVVDNYSVRTHRRAEIDLALCVSTPTEKITALISTLNDSLAHQKGQLTEQSVYLKTISKSGIHISVEYFTEPIAQEEFDQLKQVINLQILALLETKQIRFSGEQSLPSA